MLCRAPHGRATPSCANKHQRIKYQHSFSYLGSPAMLRPHSFSAFEAFLGSLLSVFTGYAHVCTYDRRKTTCFGQLWDTDP